MKKILVLGIGNRLLMDDGIGIYVVEELSLQNTNAKIKYSVGETDIAYCLNELEEASFTLIIDAAFLGKKPGDVTAISINDSFNHVSLPFSFHGIHLLEEVKLLGKQINGMLIGIEPYKMDFFLGLSPVLKEQFSLITGEIKKIIENAVIVDEKRKS